MIVGLYGKIYRKEPTYIDLDVNGVIYRVFISLNTFYNIKGENIKLEIVQIIREDANNLYGFLTEEEEILFSSLIKINGIGGKVALAICSSFLPTEFFEILHSNNVNKLKKVIGVGPKTASRIILEMSNFKLNFSEKNKAKTDAILALESLGFKKEDVSQIVNNSNFTDTADIIKDALKQLQKF